MQGLTADGYVANTSNCFNRLTNITFLKIPAFKYNLEYALDKAVVPLSTPNTVFSAYYTASVQITTLIQGFTNDAWICNSMVRNVYKIAYYKYY